MMTMTTKDFLYLVLIAVSWLLFYGMVFGLIWFGYTARTESDRCMAAYEKYLTETIANCTIRINYSEPNKPLNFTYTTWQTNGGHCP